MPCAVEFFLVHEIALDESYFTGVWIRVDLDSGRWCYWGEGAIDAEEYIEERVQKYRYSKLVVDATWYYRDNVDTECPQCHEVVQLEAGKGGRPYWRCRKCSYHRPVRYGEVLTAEEFRARAIDFGAAVGDQAEATGPAVAGVLSAQVPSDTAR